MLESFFHVFTKKWLRDVFRLAQGSGPPVLCGSLDRSLGYIQASDFFCTQTTRRVYFGICFTLPNGRLANALERPSHRVRRRVSFRSSVNTEGVTAQHYNEDEDGAV